MSRNISKMNGCLFGVVVLLIFLAEMGKKWAQNSRKLVKNEQFKLGLILS
jgi:hypothetical protein